MRQDAPKGLPSLGLPWTLRDKTATSMRTGLALPTLSEAAALSNHCVVHVGKPEVHQQPAEMLHGRATALSAAGGRSLSDHEPLALSASPSFPLEERPLGPRDDPLCCRSGDLSFVPIKASFPQPQHPMSCVSSELRASPLHSLDSSPSKPRAGQPGHRDAGLTSRSSHVFCIKCGL